MSKKQLLLWSEGSDGVVVLHVGAGLVVGHLVNGSTVGKLTLPYSRGLLMGLREACEQALRAEGVTL